MRGIATVCIRLAFPSVAALAIAACASSLGREELAERAQTELVGISAEKLLACAGAPNRRATSGGLEVLTYVVRKDTDEIAHFCEATFVLKSGRVTEVSYRGTTGLVTGRAHCGYVVENCLR